MKLGELVTVASLITPGTIYPWFGVSVFGAQLHDLTPPSLRYLRFTDKPTNYRYPITVMIDFYKFAEKITHED